MALQGKYVFCSISQSCIFFRNTGLLEERNEIVITVLRIQYNLARPKIWTPSLVVSFFIESREETEKNSVNPLGMRNKSPSLIF